ncbi:MAG TPA: 50S ribosomal protein L11 methyltransferase [Tepidisphaeraceae bacterium]|jgi:protein arginine N-methyltransferase 1|nr:50S ribosomal protein L11 methyltransferase [Tepidisphaeraceae bacterium]
MYTIPQYGKMINDASRMSAYERALRQTIRPGSVVVDIGCGTGIFSLLACRMGAKRVYAIEPSDAIQVAREIARANSFADRIEFIQDLSSNATLPERADVIVSDIHGLLPLFGKYIPTIVDARTRLLKDTGVLIPQRESLWAGIVEAPEFYQRLVSPWDEGSFKLDMRAGRNRVVNSYVKTNTVPEQLLAAPMKWGDLHHMSMGDPNFAATLRWSPGRSGIAHGIAVWFDATLADGVEITNSPGSPPLIYANTFLPLSEPVALSGDEAITLELRADLVGDDYIWRWNTRVADGSSPSNFKADFKQSTAFSEPLSLTRLRRRASDHLPNLGSDGIVDAFILAQFDGATPLQTISVRVRQKFPDEFQDAQDALTRVANMSEQYGR